LAQQVGAVTIAAEAVLSARDDRVLANEFRKILSAMRQSVALHQAEFPAVKLDEKSAKYHQSITAVRDTNAAFVQFIQHHLLK
jgi:tellurite resistance protein